MMSSKKASEIYGFVGWREFLSVRSDILREVDRAKEKNASRPIRTSHGVAAEAMIRKWLSEFLPGRYGVTSGFIIPSEVAEDYTLKHFDVIIYDKLESHTMWIDSDEDTAEQGKHRAIPAQHVAGVIECKASFTKKAAQDAMDKVFSLEAMTDYLPSKIFTAIIFADIKEADIKNYDGLRSLISQGEPLGYIGGAILRCPVNVEMSGRFYPIRPIDTVPEDNCQQCDVPLYRDVDEYLCFRQTIEGREGLMIQRGFAYDIMLWPDPSTEQMGGNILKIHRTAVGNNGRWIQMDWSHDMFGGFAMDLLAALNGKWGSSETRTPFGRVFHRVLENDGSLNRENATFVALPVPVHSYAKKKYEMS